jgi:hypothetical protein
VRPVKVIVPAVDCDTVVEVEMPPPDKMAVNEVTVDPPLLAPGVNVTSAEVPLETTDMRFGASGLETGLPNDMLPLLVNEYRVYEPLTLVV